MTPEKEVPFSGDTGYLGNATRRFYCNVRKERRMFIERRYQACSETRNLADFKHYSNACKTFQSGVPKVRPAKKFSPVGDENVILAATKAIVSYRK